MSRPKGYSPWHPNDETRVVLEQVKGILVEYRDYLPMTARQIFYRMVGAHGFEKTEKAYKRLSNYLVRARRARMISFNDIRDDGTDQHSRWESAGAITNHGGVDSVTEYYESLRGMADAYFRDQMEAQEMRIEAWCEAAGMAPQLARAANEYGITVYSTGGFSSVTVTRHIAERIRLSHKPTYLLHIGDFDPSGVSLYEAMVHDASKFAVQLSGEAPTAVRVALTEDQVDEYDIPTAPPKASDTRSVNWYGETAQAEAMPPDLLNRLLREAIEDIVDLGERAALLEEEEEEREVIRAKLESFNWGD